MKEANLQALAKQCLALKMQADAMSKQAESLLAMIHTELEDGEGDDERPSFNRKLPNIR